MVIRETELLAPRHQETWLCDVVISCCSFAPVSLSRFRTTFFIFLHRGGREKKCRAIPHQRGFKMRCFFADRRGTKVTRAPLTPAAAKLLGKMLRPQRHNWLLVPLLISGSGKLLLLPWKNVSPAVFLFAEHNFSHWFDIEAIDPAYTQLKSNLHKKSVCFSRKLNYNKILWEKLILTFLLLMMVWNFQPWWKECMCTRSVDCAFCRVSRLPASIRRARWMFGQWCEWEAALLAAAAISSAAIAAICEMSLQGENIN